ncbi:NUDIX domain-containing protein [archaeon]|nr:NUDIX domain-containing protein [archaeon]
MDSVGIILRNEEGKFLLQHRDDKEEIACRNMWGLFGGAVDGGEAPEEAVVREIMEELCFDVSGKVKFIEKINIPGISDVYIYEYLGTVEIDELEQKEGQGMRFFSVEEVRKENVVLSVRKFIESGKVL